MESIILGTFENFKSVVKIIEKAGFNDKMRLDSKTCAARMHDKYNLRAQVHSHNSYFNGSDVLTQIEFNNLGEIKKNYNEVLNKLYQEIPNLISRKLYGNQKNPSKFLKPKSF